MLESTIPNRYLSGHMVTARSIGAWLIRRWLGSLRWHVQVPVLAEPVVYCVWHRDVFAAGAWLRDHAVTSLVSASGDGDFLVEVLSGRGMDFERGSDTRNAVSGARSMLRRLRSGRSVATTWDGPRGPAETRKNGPLWLARASRAPMVELRFGYGPHLRLRDWSRLRIPLPWTKIDVTVAA
jgi:lysophospholipid acyltransferase (LPLAT)-like uncharacterized protein